MTDIRTLAMICAALLASLASLAGPSWAQSLSNPAFSEADPPGLPSIGKWMLTAQDVPSDWLGEVYEGKILREPINIIIVDEGAISRADAVARLIAAARSAGYPIRLGHSAGYQAVIGGQLFAQLPKGWDDAFSNEVFELSNNHGRIFGPYMLGQIYLFTGAFSRERVDPFRWPGHRFASFNQARNDFVERMDRTTAYKMSSSVSLDNALADNPKLTTGDHDGNAFILRAGP
ncbi:hypothetical protein [Microvirga guangxiensis]|uniref:Uncharacterized protein n=1 Tax=Microvirga guangxiensis TaxID=549386 RepID=A0A1G5JJE2_9HYPH|nr:hypothetical protein [Microvirga guangxiensis]SCY88437.1 hypothetical protein SAMN02927923_02686 [Microvirga guangxiensis]